MPLIISAPSQKSRGGVSKATVELIAIYPTLADYAGLKAPDNLQGTSLRPLLDDPQTPWTRPAFTQTARGKKDGEFIFGRSVRTDRWRYPGWKNGAAGTELHDHDNDPREYTSLAQDPAFAAERESWRPSSRRCGIKTSDYLSGASTRPFGGFLFPA